MHLLISPKELRALLSVRIPLALLDVREQGEFNTAHIAGATPLPRRLLEFLAPQLVPNLKTEIITYDDDGQRSALAAATLGRMGYQHIRVLTGGLIRWASEGLTTEWGVNVASKTFGERLLQEVIVPEITPQELRSRLNRGEEVVLLDARTVEEHRHATIPGRRSMPGGELAVLAAETLKQVGYQHVRVLIGGVRS